LNQSSGSSITLVLGFLPRLVIVSRYLIYIADFESKIDAASLNSFAEAKSDYAFIIFA